MKTYDIKSEFYAIQELLENPEVNEETGEVINNTEAIQQLLNEIEGERDNKADNIAYLIQEAKDKEEALKSEISRLQERKKMFEREQAKLKELLDFLLGGEKIKTTKHTFSYRNSKSVQILDESLIDDKYMKIETTKTPKKKDIKLAIESLKDGETFKGAEIVSNKSLTIK